MKTKHNIINHLYPCIPQQELTPAAKQRFAQSFRMLGAQQEAPKDTRRKWSRMPLAISMVVIMLLGISVSVFAGILPNLFNPKVVTTGKNPVAGYLDTYAGTDVSFKAVSDAESPYNIVVDKTFYDGDAVYLSLTLTAPQGTSDLYEWIYADNTITINGIENGETGSQTFLKTDTPDEYRAGISMAMPSQLQGEQSLTVTLEILPLHATRHDAMQGDSVKLGDAKFLVTVPLEMNKSRNIQQKLSAEDNGIKILGIDATPMRTIISVEAPYWGENTYQERLALYTMDGEEIRWNLAGTSDLENAFDIFRKDTASGDLLFDGIPADAQTILFRWYKGSSYQDVVAEFTINLTDGTAAPSTTYKDGGRLDLNNEYHFSSIHWVFDTSGTYATPTDDGAYDLQYGVIGTTPSLFTNNCLLTEFSYYNEEETLTLTVATLDDYQDKYVEIYRGDELLGRVDAKDVQSYSIFDTAFTRPSSHIEDRRNHPLKAVHQDGTPYSDEENSALLEATIKELEDSPNTYDFGLKLNKDINISMNDVFTVKLFDTDTGLEILSKEVSGFTRTTGI